MHAAAFGLSIPDNQFEDFLDYADDTLPTNAFIDLSYPVDYIFDATENFNYIGLQLGTAENLWGNGIDTPTIVVEKIPMSKSKLKVMGAGGDSIKFSHGGIDYVKFKDTNFIDELMSMEDFYITVYGEFNVNYWGGRASVQIFIKDYEAERIETSGF